MRQERFLINVSYFCLAAIFTKSFTCCSHVQYTNLPEIRARLERGHHGLPVVADNLQATPVHDVHLLANFA